MAHRTTQRPNLAAPDHPNTSTDPTHKKQPKSSISTAAAKPRHRHHPSDRDSSGPSSTIHTLSKHFSKLYTSHHHKVPSKPRIDTHLQSKPMAITSATEDTSSKPITKSAPQHRRTVAEIEKDRLRSSITGAIDNNNNKNSWKESHDQSHHKTDKIKKFSKTESHDLKKPPASLLSRSLDSGLKGAREENYNQRPQFSLAVAAGGGGRRSFSNSQAELDDFFSCNGVKVVSVDMPPFMQVHAVDCARKTFDSLEKFTSKTLAFALKKEFDGVYGPAWHCVVGTSFGSFVTHSVGGFLYFSMDHKLYILLFKTTVQRAD